MDDAPGGALCRSRDSDRAGRPPARPTTVGGVSIWVLIVCAIVAGFLLGLVLIRWLLGELADPELAERKAVRNAKPRGNVERL